VSDPGPYTKKALTFADQIALLQERGLTVSDPDEAQACLERVGYYRLSAYWYPFKHNGESLAGGSFDKVIKLYEFDRRLRLLMLDAIERIEVAFRTAVSYQLGHAFGAFGHEDPNNFRDDFGDPPDPSRSRASLTHEDWLRDLHDETERSREVFVASFQERYTDYPRLPVWMVTEVMSFGTLSKLFRAMLPDQQRPVIVPYEIHQSVACSWLHTLSFVRNACAHHSRIWNRELPVSPKLPRGDSDWSSTKFTNDRRIYVALLILRHLTRSHQRGDAWARDAVTLLGTWDSEERWQRSMGMPTTWREHPFWKV
jgi:abortive infection bacteriophage resistance protein